jgi:hypothetical protein
MISVYGMTAADPIRPLRWQDLVWLVLSGVLAWGFSLLSGAWRLLPLVSCGAFVFWQQASYADADLLWQETRNRKSLALFLQDFSFLNYCRFQNPFVSFALSRIHSRQFARILSIAGCLLPMLWLPRRAAWVLLAPVFAMVIGQLTHDSLAVMCLLWAWGCPIPLVSGVLLAVTLWVKPVALLAVIACALTHGWMTIMVCLLVTPWYVLAFRTEYWMRRLLRVAVAALWGRGVAVSVVRACQPS